MSLLEALSSSTSSSIIKLPITVRDSPFEDWIWELVLLSMVGEVLKYSTREASIRPRMKIANDGRHPTIRAMSINSADCSLFTENKVDIPTAASTTDQSVVTDPSLVLELRVTTRTTLTIMVIMLTVNTIPADNL